MNCYSLECCYRLARLASLYWNSSFTFRRENAFFQDNNEGHLTRAKSNEWYTKQLFWSHRRPIRWACPSSHSRLICILHTFRISILTVNQRHNIRKIRYKEDEMLLSGSVVVAWVDVTIVQWYCSSGRRRPPTWCWNPSSVTTASEASSSLSRRLEGASPKHEVKLYCCPAEAAIHYGAFQHNFHFVPGPW